MCGIAGIFHFASPRRPIDVRVLDAATDSLAHRGPDGRGTWTAPGVGLGHRRLSIIDLSDAARQPMTYADERFVITFNGEIYNFAELRATLEGLGHRFRSSGDTEVLVAGYAEWGEALVEHVSGIYAFAIWDADRAGLFLARDPLGVKPLFYSLYRGTLRFGSEIKAILSDPAMPREVDPVALDAYLTFGYTPAPRTGFQHIRQLEPGFCAWVDPAGLRTRRYWAVPYAPEPAYDDFARARADFADLLERVTAAQLVSDVPVGAFLSGGLDSAAIVHAMTRAGRGDVQAITVGFDADGFDERGAAKQTADALGVALTQRLVSLDAAALLPEISRHMEEPTADSSMLPVYLLCQAARERFTVAMSGDGADEILAGYETYRATALARRYRLIPGVIRRGLIAPLAHRLPIGDGKYHLHQVATRFVRGAEQGPGRDHCAWRCLLDEALKSRLYQPEFAAALSGADAIGLYAAKLAEVPSSRAALDGLLHADTSFYLPNDMLIKVDRMSMAHGLEVRVPFLDIAMVRFAASLPAEFKLHRGRRRKHILRESLHAVLPPGILARPKSGFNIPLEAWMRGGLRELLLDGVRTHRAELSRYLKIDEFERLADEHQKRRAEHAHALFGVLMLTLWFENAARAWKTIPATAPGVALAAT